MPGSPDDEVNKNHAKTSPVYPEPTDWLTITKLDHPFGDAEVYVEVNRNSDRLGFYRSHRPILAASSRAEMTTIGDVFTWPQNAASK